MLDVFVGTDGEGAAVADAAVAGHTQPLQLRGLVETLPADDGGTGGGCGDRCLPLALLDVVAVDVDIHLPGYTS